MPVVNLDCAGTPENVWNQLLAIGRLMRPAAQLRIEGNSNGNGNGDASVLGMFESDDEKRNA